MKKLAVLISGRGSNMQALIEAFDSAQSLARVVCVLSDKTDAAGLSIASLLGVPHVHAVPRSNYDTVQAFEAAMIEILHHHHIDLVCLAGFMRILSPEFCHAFAGRIINIHPSLLPLYKGLNTHQRALDNGDARAGCTVHYVTAELDSGATIAQSMVPILPNDTAQTLAQRVLAAEHVLYPQAVRGVLSGL